MWRHTYGPMQRNGEIPYRRLLDTLDEGFAVLQRIERPGGKPDFKIVDANPVFATFGGAQSGDLIGKSLLEVFPRDAPPRLPAYEAVQRTGDSIRFERALAQWFASFFATKSTELGESR